MGKRGEKQAVGDLKKFIEILRAENKLDEMFVGYRSLTPLTWAVGQEQLDVVKMLLDANANVDAQDYYGTALMRAAYDTNLEMVYFLLEKKANVNARSKCGKTALMGASLRGEHKTVSALLKAGAEIDAQDDDGTTALMEAVHGRSGRNIVAVNVLLKAQANVDIRNNKNRTALCIAKYKGFEKIAATINEFK